MSEVNSAIKLKEQLGLGKTFSNFRVDSVVFAQKQELNVEKNLTFHFNRQLIGQKTTENPEQFSEIRESNENESKMPQNTGQSSFWSQNGIGESGSFVPPEIIEKVLKNQIIFPKKEGAFSESNEVRKREGAKREEELLKESIRLGEGNSPELGINQKEDRNSIESEASEEDYAYPFIFEKEFSKVKSKDSKRKSLQSNQLNSQEKQNSLHLPRISSGHCPQGQSSWEKGSERAFYMSQSIDDFGIYSGFMPPSSLYPVNGPIQHPNEAHEMLLIPSSHFEGHFESKTQQTHELIEPARNAINNSKLNSSHINSMPNLNEDPTVKPDSNTLNKPPPQAPSQTPSTSSSGLVGLFKKISQKNTTTPSSSSPLPEECKEDGSISMFLTFKDLPGHSVTLDMLFNLSSVYGNINSIKFLHSSMKTAVVAYQDQFQAAIAKANLNNCPVFGSCISVVQSSKSEVLFQCSSQEQYFLFKDFSTFKEQRFKIPGSKNFKNFSSPCQDLHISNINPHYGCAFFQNLFESTVFPIQVAYFSKNPSMGVVSCASTDHAIRILMTFHNYNVDS